MGPRLGRVEYKSPRSGHRTEAGVLQWGHA